MNTVTTSNSSIPAAFARITQLLNTEAFCIEDGAVLYCKPVPGSTMTLDQWLQLNKLGQVVYASRLVQQDEGHISYPVHAEFEVLLPLDQAEALALSWLAESKLSQTVDQLRSRLASYQHVDYA